MYIPPEKRNLVFRCRTCHRLFHMAVVGINLPAEDRFLENTEAVAAVLAGAEINPLYCSECVHKDQRRREFKNA